VTNEPFDEAWVHVAVRTLREDDVLRTIAPVGEAGRHELGRYLGGYAVKWDDEEQPRQLSGSNRVMRLVRQGEPRGVDGQLGTVDLDPSITNA
jgi:hypothetical protein